MTLGGVRLAPAAAALALAIASSSAHAAGKAASPPAAAPASAAASAPAAPPVEFAGTFVAGTTYVGDMVYDARVLKTWRPLKDVQPGNNVAWTVKWTNLDQFPALAATTTQGKTQRFRFRVVKADVLSGSPQMPWMATYQCEVLAVGPAAAAAPPHLQPQQPTRKR